MKAKPKRTHPIYGSAKWKALRARMQRQHRHCHDCGRTNTRLYADHVIELIDGGAPFDPANVVMRCARCHAIKTHAERERRRARAGLPRPAKLLPPGKQQRPSAMQIALARLMSSS